MAAESSEALQNSLSQGLAKLTIEATGDQKKKLLTLLEQLVKWNKAYNLTAIKSPKEGLVLHILDSLAVLPHITHSSLLDVGTGAGFPGLPLAIMLPNTQFTLLDSNSKKVRFIQQMVHMLKLNNVEAIHSRVESYSNQGVDAVISRAFASIEDMVSQTKHLLNANGKWLAMKGVYSLEEVQAGHSIATEVICHPINVPGLDAKRCLIELEKVKGAF